MDAFQIFTVSGIGITAILGFYNLNLNLKNQRKSHRELIFQKQFEFFIHLQGLIAKLEDSLIEINMEASELNEIQESVAKFANEIDFEISKNELLIPDVIYSQISDFSGYCHDISSLTYEDPAKITREFHIEFTKKNEDLIDLIRDFIGVEKLSDENRKLVRSMLKEI